MKTWCDDAITGVKQERAGTQGTAAQKKKKRKKENLKWFLFSLKYHLHPTGVFSERDPTHPLTPKLKCDKLSSLAGV